MRSPVGGCLLARISTPNGAAPRVMGSGSEGGAALQPGGGDFYAPLLNPDTGAYRFLIDGEWRDSASGAVVHNANPSKGNARCFGFQACTKDEVDAAYAGAKAAQREWGQVPLHRRASILHAAAELMRAHHAPIADALVKEIAKPRKDATTEAKRSADLIDYAAEEGSRSLAKGDMITSDSFPGSDRDKLCMAHKVPLGVVLCIPPFNYPVNLAVSKIAPALIAGNACVVKPPTQGCVSALMMAQCFNNVPGMPKGLVQCVTGRGADIGDYMVEHPGANCISFTGGDTGLSVSRKARMVPVQMELGGKDACIVFPDADLDLAAAAIVKGGFSYSGQRCTAVKIVVAFNEIADDLVAKVEEKVRRLTVGAPEDDAQITAVVSAKSADFIQGLVEDAVAKGATMRTEWRRDQNLVWPALVDDVTDDMRLCWEEPFGPVVPIVRVSTEDDALRYVNESKYGLQGCVFTRDIDRAIRVADRMETGTVQINGPPARGPDHFPFQGVKDSGIGSQGIVNSIEMMTKVKSTVINLAKPSYAMA